VVSSATKETGALGRKVESRQGIGWSLFKKKNYSFALPIDFEARRHCTCKEMPVIHVNRVVDKKRIIKKWRAEEEEGHKGSLTKNIFGYLLNGQHELLLLDDLPDTQLVPLALLGSIL
jgi:hypothetical protein